MGVQLETLNLQEPPLTELKYATKIETFATDNKNQNSGLVKFSLDEHKQMDYRMFFQDEHG